MSALSSPLRLADLNLANRIVVSPMCQYSANDGIAKDSLGGEVTRPPQYQRASAVLWPGAALRA